MSIIDLGVDINRSIFTWAISDYSRDGVIAFPSLASNNHPCINYYYTNARFARIFWCRLRLVCKSWKEFYESNGFATIYIAKCLFLDGLLYNSVPINFFVSNSGQPYSWVADYFIKLQRKDNLTSKAKAALSNSTTILYVFDKYVRTCQQEAEAKLRDLKEELLQFYFKEDQLKSKKRKLMEKIEEAKREKNRLHKLLLQ
jgi:hypothetical protein